MSTDTFDFGFTAVESMEEYVPPAQNVNKEEITDLSLKIAKIESTQSDILNILERIENSGTSLDTDEYKQLIERDVREKLSKVENMIMPLLSNLMKDSDKKDYIKWPNRKAIIEQFTEKLLQVTRS